MATDYTHSELVSLMPTKAGSGVLTPQSKKVKILAEQGCTSVKGPKDGCAYMRNRFGMTACIDKYGDIDWEKNETKA